MPRGRRRDPSIGRNVYGERLGLSLASARASVGLTQGEAAQVSGVSRTVIIQTETGRTLPNVRTLVTLARTYGRTVASICKEAGL